MAGRVGRCLDQQQGSGRETSSVYMFRLFIGTQVGFQVFAEPAGVRGTWEGEVQALWL